MKPNQIYNHAKQFHNKLTTQDNHYRHELIDEITQLTNDFENMTNGKTKTVNDYYETLQAEKLKKRINHDKSKLEAYQTQQQDKEYIVICPWTENDLSDSNEDLITQKNMQSWRYNGCKVYGKAGNDPSALNHQDNRGFFAQFNYPINIIKNPSIYYFTPAELKALYIHITANNPSLKDILLTLAVKGSITVSDFKKRFKLDAKSLKARLKKLKFDNQNNIPDTTITNLQNYYRWELKQRKSYSGGDLSQYDNVNSGRSDFNSDLNDYKIYGHDDSDFYSDNSDINSDDYTPSDIENGMNYQGYTPSDIAAGMEYDDEHISDNNEDE